MTMMVTMIYSKMYVVTSGTSDVARTLQENDYLPKKDDLPKMDDLLIKDTG